MEALQERCIHIQKGPNKLRWGYLSKGTYNTREDYKITFNQGQIQHMDTWNVIWHFNPWPKIATFIWLVAHRQILVGEI